MMIAVVEDESTQLSKPICPGLGSTSLIGGVDVLGCPLSGGIEAVNLLALLACFIDDDGEVMLPSSMARCLYVLEQGP